MAVAARYLARELFSVLAMAVLVLLVVVVGGRFIGYLQEAALGKYPADSLLTILWLRLPEFLQLLLPFALFIAILVTFGRLFAEREMAVLQSGGAGTSRLIRWLALPCLLIASIVGFLSLHLTPGANFKMKSFLVEQRARPEFDNVNPGVFLSYGRGSRVTYAEEISADRRTLSRVFMSQTAEGEPDVVVWADSGSQYVDSSTGSRFLLLKDGHRYQGNIGDPNYQVVGFATLSQRISDDGRRPVRFSSESASTLSLLDKPDAINRAELHWRIALPVFTLISAALGLAMSRVKPRQGRFAKVVPGLGVFLAYYLLLLLNQNAIREDTLPDYLGMWGVHMLFLIIAVYLLGQLDRPVRN